MCEVKYLYFPINKCGNTSFKKIFEKYNHIVIPNLNLDNDENKNLHLLKKNFDKFFKFTLIKHPLNRLISAINMFITNKLITMDNWKKVFDIMKNHESYNLTNKNMNDYIKRHTLPLTSPLYCLLNNKNEIAVDLVIKLENINYKQFFNKIKINENEIIPFENKSKKYITINNFSKDDLIFVYEYYKKDLIIFNYDKIF